VPVIRRVVRFRLTGSNPRPTAGPLRAGSRVVQLGPRLCDGDGRGGIPGEHRGFSAGEADQIGLSIRDTFRGNGRRGLSLQHPSRSSTSRFRFSSEWRASRAALLVKKSFGHLPHMPEHGEFISSVTLVRPQQALCHVTTG